MQIEKEAGRPPQGFAAEPLTEAEMSTIRETIKELRGAARVWDVLSQEKLTNRSSEDLRTLYYQQGYGATAGGSWRRLGEQSGWRGEHSNSCTKRPARCLLSLEISKDSSRSGLLDFHVVGN